MTLCAQVHEGFDNIGGGLHLVFKSIDIFRFCLRRDVYSQVTDAYAQDYGISIPYPQSNRNSPSDSFSTAGRSSGLTRERIVPISYTGLVEYLSNLCIHPTYLCPACFQRCKPCFTLCSPSLQLCNACLAPLRLPRIVLHPSVDSLLPEQLHTRVKYGICMHSVTGYSTSTWSPSLGSSLWDAVPLR